MKKIIFVCLFILFSFNVTYASESDNINNFLNELHLYGNEFFPSVEKENVLQEIVEGKFIEKESFINKIFQKVFSEFSVSITLITEIIFVTILCSFIKNISASNSNVKEVAFYIGYLIILILVLSSYENIVSICSETILKLSQFMNLIIPLLLSLLIANGSIATAGIIQPSLLVATTFINFVITKFILPLTTIILIMRFVNNISETINFSKLPDMIQKFSISLLKGFVIIFVAVVSVEGSLSANVDGFAAKTTKAIVSTTIPVVRKSFKRCSRKCNWCCINY